MMFMGMVSTWGGPRTPGTAYVYGYHAQGEFEGHFGRYGLPDGGMGAISRALQNGLEAHGGAVRTGAPVARVLVEDGVARGVALESGEIVSADIVVSNADPIRSLVGLLPEGALPAEMRAAASDIPTCGSMGRIHLLIDELPDYVGFPAGEQGPQHEGLVILGPTPALYEEAWQAQQRGAFPDDYVMEALIPSVTHPSLCEPGLHTLTLGVQQLPFELAEGTWDNRKEEWADLVTDIYFRYAPNIREHTLGRHVITPLDLETEYYITGGSRLQNSDRFGAEREESVRQATALRRRAVTGHPLVNDYLMRLGKPSRWRRLRRVWTQRSSDSVFSSNLRASTIWPHRLSRESVTRATVIGSIRRTEAGRRVGGTISLASSVARTLSERLNRSVEQ